MHKFYKSQELLNKYLSQKLQDGKAVSLCTWQQKTHNNNLIEHYIIDQKSTLFIVYPDGNGFDQYNISE